MHKFDVSKKHKLDNPKRREMLPIEKIVNEIELDSNDKFADIGCGIGFFSIPVAKKINEAGMVYALDVESEMIEEVNQRIQENHLTNVKTILTDGYDFKLEDDSVSKALISTVLHEIGDKKRFVQEASRILERNGKIAIIEWIKRETDWGPPISHRVGSEEIKQILKDCSFEKITELELNKYFYIITANKVS